MTGRLPFWCRIGLHSWGLWSDLPPHVGDVPAYQQRTCIRCPLARVRSKQR